MSVGTLSFIKMKHYSVFLGPRVSEIDGEHVPVFSPDVLGDGLSWSFDKFFRWKDANVGCFIAILNLGSADTFFKG